MPVCRTSGTKRVLSAHTVPLRSFYAFAREQLQAGVQPVLHLLPQRRRGFDVDVRDVAQDVLNELGRLGVRDREYVVVSFPRALLLRVPLLAGDLAGDIRPSEPY